MKYNWKEITIRATKFAKDWQDDPGRERASTQLFYNAFFEVFGVSVRRINFDFEEPVKKNDGNTGFIDGFWPGKLLIEQKSKGGNLIAAKEQARRYLPNLKDSELPRFLLVSDFKFFELYDLDESRVVKFNLQDFPNYVREFAFIVGKEPRHSRENIPVNLTAVKLVSKLHDDLKNNNYSSPDLEKILVRLVFCMFADKAGIFKEPELFLELLENKTQESGEDVGRTLIELFQVLDKPENKRSQNLGYDLRDFSYIDGELFEGQVEVPSFNAIMRENLMEASRFDWSAISPAIFGNLFQFVVNEDNRKQQGTYYTSEKNILKVLEPLFLNSLRNKFEKLKGLKTGQRLKKLQEFHTELSKLNFFDPACGCGNFLVIAYREIRSLEIDLIREIRKYGEEDDVLISKLDVNQFYGIEINEFAVHIAKTSLWMMDHLMNRQLNFEFDTSYERIPITNSPKIIHDDALEIEWEDVIPPQKCNYIFGNPPFIGSQKRSDKQRMQMKRIIDPDSQRIVGSLDFVSAWFVKAAKYVQSSETRIGFVATSSITQGRQVSQLWPILFDQFMLEIQFAHQTFAWKSEARKNSHVAVVIIGLGKVGSMSGKKSLFLYDDTRGEPYQKCCSKITSTLEDATLFDSLKIEVKNSRHALNHFPTMQLGTKPICGGHYTFNNEQKKSFLRIEPSAKSLFRPYVDAETFLHGGNRWLLVPNNANKGKLSKMPHVIERIKRVKNYRQSSDSKQTQEFAEFPMNFHVTTIPRKPFLVFPRVSTARRDYLPIDWLKPPKIPSDALLIVEDADIELFGLLTSKMHMCWYKRIGGKLNLSYRYSAGMVYNTFPIPAISARSRRKIAETAQKILDERKNHKNSTFNDLYNPDLMPEKLKRAHRALDREVDKTYRKEPFSTDDERVAFLLDSYNNML